MLAGLFVVCFTSAVLAEGQQSAGACPAVPAAKRFDGKVIAVAGASSGIGEVLARQLASDGARVVMGARRVEQLQRIQEEIEAAGGRAEVQHLDVLDYASCERFVQFANATFGHLDGAINNAGGGESSGDFMTMEVDAFKKVFDLNFLSVYHMMKAELTIMTGQQRGSIVNNLSILKDRRFTAAPAYGAAKAAALALQETAAATVAATQVRINSISPGFTLPSEALDVFLAANPEAKALFNAPQGRMMDAGRDVYPATAYLLDDASAGVTGIDIPVAGGLNINEFKLR